MAKAAEKVMAGRGSKSDSALLLSQIIEAARDAHFYSIRLFSAIEVEFGMLSSRQVEERSNAIGCHKRLFEGVSMFSAINLDLLDVLKGSSRAARSFQRAALAPVPSERVAMMLWRKLKI